MIYGFISLQAKKEDIVENKSNTYGIVTRSRPIVNQFSKRRYDYDFYVKGQKFSGSSIGWLSDNIAIGKYYPVEFSSENPMNNQMDFKQEYSKKQVENANGQIDTIYIPSSEPELPKDLIIRLEKLKSGKELKN